MFMCFQRTYKSETACLEAELESIPSLLNQDKQMSRAFRFAKGEYAEQLNSMLSSERDTIQARINWASDNIRKSATVMRLSLMTLKKLLPSIMKLHSSNWM